MHNNRSCRACGTHLTPISLCNICKEYVSWTCGKCLKMDDVTHRHDYCRISYRVEEAVVNLRSPPFLLKYDWKLEYFIHCDVIENQLPRTRHFFIEALHCEGMKVR